MWIITNGDKYYAGIKRQKDGLMNDDLDMVRKSKAKTFKNYYHASASARYLGIRFGIKLIARRI